MIVQNRIALPHHKMFEIRQFVVIVPYRTSDDGCFKIMSALVNISVLMVWLGGASLFTAVWFGIQKYVIRDDCQRSVAKIFFTCLAEMLGNSAGNLKSNWLALSFLTFLIGISATLTSALFTGAIVEQLLHNDPPKQMELLSELLNSSLTLIECWPCLYTENR